MFQYEYARPAVSVDMIVRRHIDGHPHLLLIQRKYDPFKGAWALPGGFLDIDETLEEAARRELREETGLEAGLLMQIGTFSKVDRDPRTRVITTAFFAEVDDQQQPVASDDAAEYRWIRSDEPIDLAFDHAEIIKCWKESLR